MNEIDPHKRNRPGNVTLVLGLLSVLLLAAIFLAPGFLAEEEALPLQSFELDESNQVVAQIPSGVGGLRVGDIAPDFTLMTPGGGERSLSELRGTGVMINFWATWCAPCRVEMPAMQSAYDKRRADGFEILALNVDDAADTINAYLDELELDFPALMDENGVVAYEYGAFNVLPSSFFIDPDGVIAAVHRGPVTESQLEQYIDLIVLEP